MKGSWIFPGIAEATMVEKKSRQIDQATLSQSVLDRDWERRGAKLCSTPSLHHTTQPSLII